MTGGGGLDLDACICGLRNLAVMDDEETRIDQYVDNDSISDVVLRARVKLLVVNGKYDDAYEEAIRPTLVGLSRDEAKRAAIVFCRDFILEDDVDPSDVDDYREKQIVDLVEDIMSVFDGLREKWLTATST